MSFLVIEADGILASASGGNRLTLRGKKTVGLNMIRPSLNHADPSHSGVRSGAIDAPLASVPTTAIFYSVINLCSVAFRFRCGRVDGEVVTVNVAG